MAPRADHLDRLPQAVQCRSLVPHLRRHLVLGGGFAQGAGFHDGPGQRLLAVHMFSGADRPHRSRACVWSGCSPPPRRSSPPSRRTACGSRDRRPPWGTARATWPNGCHRCRRVRPRRRTFPPGRCPILPCHPRQCRRRGGVRSGNLREPTAAWGGDERPGSDERGLAEEVATRQQQGHGSSRAAKGPRRNALGRSGTREQTVADRTNIISRRPREGKRTRPGFEPVKTAIWRWWGRFSTIARTES